MITLITISALEDYFAPRDRVMLGLSQPVQPTTDFRSPHLSDGAKEYRAQRGRIPLEIQEAIASAAQHKLRCIDASALAKDVVCVDRIPSNAFQVQSKAVGNHHPFHYD
jgi:hypothetical protein